jgi:hypothetical protein
MFAGIEAGESGRPKEKPVIITPAQLVEIVGTMIAARDGEVVTQALAFERARNIATALSNTLVLP